MRPGWRFTGVDPAAPMLDLARASFPQDEPARTRWLDRYAAFAIASGADPAEVGQAHEAVRNSLTLLTPGEDEACLHEAGFANVEMFYAAFTWRGRVARA